MEIECNGAVASLKSTVKNMIPTGSLQYFSVDFTFDTEWDNVLYKIAVFHGNNQIKSVVILDDTCIIPSEVIAGVGDLLVGIVGADNLDLSLATTILTTNLTFIGETIRGAISANTILEVTI